MKFTMTVSAYDALDSVWASLIVRVYEDYETASGHIALERRELLRGVGEDEVQCWARDVLVCLLETL